MGIMKWLRDPSSPKPMAFGLNVAAQPVPLKDSVPSYCPPHSPCSCYLALCYLEEHFHPSLHTHQKNGGGHLAISCSLYQTSVV